MADLEQQLVELQKRLAELTQRVYLLENAAGVAPPAAEPPGAPRSATPPPPPPPLSRPAAPTGSIPPPRFGDLGSAPKLMQQIPERDLESMLGGQWLNRIGIAALLIGAAYFLKLAFDNGWIGPSGRVAIGMLAGIALVIWADRIHGRGLTYFAYSLTSVGAGIMYLSLWAAFQLYHLVPGGMAFVGMIAVTVSTAVIAVRKDAQIVAAVALAGGFATPMLLSTGENRPVELFSYLLMLDLFAIILAVYRPWRRLLAGAFVATVGYYFGWADRFYDDGQRFTATLVVTGIFAVFAGLPLIRQLQTPLHLDDAQPVAPGRSKTLIAIAVLVPIFYFGVLYALYEADYQEGMAWVAVGLAAIYIVMSRRLDVELAEVPPEDRLEKWLHLAIGMGFLTLAVPIKLEGHWISLGWLVEAGLLLVVGQRARNDFLKYAALVTLALGIFRLVLIEDFVVTRFIANWRFFTYLVAITVVGGIAWVIRDEHGSRHKAFTIALICVNVLALLALNYEVSDYFYRHGQQANTLAPNQYDWRETQRARDFSFSALWMVYGCVALVIGFWRKLASLRWQALVLIGLTIAKVFLYDLSNLSGAWRVLSFIGLGVLLMAISYLYQKGWLKVVDDED